MSSLPRSPDYFIAKLRELHLAIRNRIIEERMQVPKDQLTAVYEREGDTAFGVDLASEELLLEFCEGWSQELPLILIAEGLPERGWQCFPSTCNCEDAEFILIVDPIDGSREIMYDKRSAWVLSGIAPNRGIDTRLSDIEIAMQTEIPTTRQYLADTLWAVRNCGVHAERCNLLTGDVQSYTPQPSVATTLRHGFAMLSKFFPAGKQLLAWLEEELVRRLLGECEIPLTFDDQYISTAGQLYELIIGHDRFNADLRPLVFKALELPDDETPLCAHPYDLCTELIAREAGVIVTDEKGMQLNAPLDVRANVSWIGYANETLRKQIEPVLHELLTQLPEVAKTLPVIPISRR